MRKQEGAEWWLGDVGLVKRTAEDRNCEPSCCCMPESGICVLCDVAAEWLKVVMLWQWRRGRGEKRGPVAHHKFFAIRKIFSVVKFWSNNADFGAKDPPFWGNFKAKIEILSIDDILCRKNPKFSQPSCLIHDAAGFGIWQCTGSQLVERMFAITWMFRLTLLIHLSKLVKVDMFPCHLVSIRCLTAAAIRQPVDHVVYVGNVADLLYSVHMVYLNNLVLYANCASYNLMLRLVLIICHFCKAYGYML